MFNFSEGYFKLPRSLTRSELWLDLSMQDRIVFLTILDHVVFVEREYDDHGHKIILNPGQICITERLLAQYCGKEFNKTKIHRSIKKLIYMGFLHQEVNHVKNVLTIAHLDTYNLVLNQNEPGFEPRLNQDRTKIEPQSNNQITKKVKKPPTNQSLPSKVEALPVGESAGPAGGFSEISKTGTEGHHPEGTHNKSYQTLSITPNSVLIPIYDCLVKVNIDIVDKQRLTKEFDEQIVQKAVSHCSVKGFTPQKSLDASLFYFCKNPEHVKPPKSEVIKSQRIKKDNLDALIANRKAIAAKISAEMIKLLPDDKFSHTRFRSGYDHVQISNDRISAEVYFNAPNFKNDVLHNLRKCSLPIPDLVNSMA